jgi:hypothetical protein
MGMSVEWSVMARVLYVSEELAASISSVKAIYFDCVYNGGMQKCSWLRHYATRRKVVGSIPDEVIGFFN